MIEKINDLSFSKALDSNYLLSLFHSKNIETNLKIASIVSQYDSNIDFFSVFSKAKVFKMDKSFKRFDKRLQSFMNELTTQEKNLSHINNYLTVVSRISMFKSIISRLNSLSEIVITLGKDYFNSLYSKEQNEDIKVVLSQFNMFLVQLKDISKKPISRMSTKSNTDKLIEDDIKGIPTPKFVGFEPGEEQNSFSFDAGSSQQNIIIPIHLQKEEQKYINRLNLFRKATSANDDKVDSFLFTELKNKTESGDKPMPCLETLKTINEMFQSKIITQENRSMLKEKLLEKDNTLLSLLKMSSTKEILIAKLKEYLLSRCKEYNKCK